MHRTSSLCRGPLIAVTVLCGALSASLVRAEDAKATKPDVTRIAIFPGQMVRINIASRAFIGSSGVCVGDFSLSTANNHLFFLEKTRFRCGTKLVTISE